MMMSNSWKVSGIGRIVALVVCVGLVGCKSNGDDWRSELDALEDTMTLVEFTDAFADGFVSGDANAVAAMMTEDFVALTPGRDPIIGRDAARAAMAEDLAGMKVHSLQFVTREIEIHNNWAWAWGTSTASITPEGHETAVTLRGQFLWVLQRDLDGHWFIARDCSHGGESK